MIDPHETLKYWNLICTMKTVLSIRRLELTLRSSDERKPPIHRKHRSAGVFHIPDKIWKTSAFAAVPFNLKMSSKCVVTLSTIMRSSASPACELTAVLNSFIFRLCSSSHRAYSKSNASAPVHHQSMKIRDLKLENKKALNFYILFWRGKRRKRRKTLIE